MCEFLLIGGEKELVVSIVCVFLLIGGKKELAGCVHCVCVCSC